LNNILPVFHITFVEFWNKIYSGNYNQSWVGCRCYVRLDFVWQFKSELVRRLEGLVFEEKKVHNLTLPNLKKLKVKKRINQTKTGPHLSLTNVNFDQGNGT
jgi:hypothetical protein